MPLTDVILSLTLVLGTVTTLALTWLAAEAFRGAMRIRRGEPAASPEAAHWARKTRSVALVGFLAFLLLASTF